MPKSAVKGGGVLDAGSHFTYLWDSAWLLSDTYPTGPDRLQTPHLYHLASGRCIDLGDFPSPAAYTGEWRLDTHPRLNRAETRVCIDSAHGGQGRQLHFIEIEGVG